MAEDDRTEEVRDRRRVEAVERWFPGAARDLPWRRTRSGWAALVSELMLQQTQVSRVSPAFISFMRVFPTPAACAAAREQAVLAAWEGMGYYRRARFLHAAAKEIVESCGGEVPTDARRLRMLPGVGRYTAGAVASIAFGAREPIVDGNIERVFARWSGRCPGSDAAAQRHAHREAWQTAERLVALAEEPAIFNEGLMELGATICTPARPACERCPVAAECSALRMNRVHEIPAPRVRVPRKGLFIDAVLLRCGERTLLEQRAPEGLWAGLWQLPAMESDAARPPARAAVRRWLLCHLGEHARLGRELAQHEALLTHRKVSLRVWSAEFSGEMTSETEDRPVAARDAHWLSATEALQRPMSSLHRRVVDELSGVG